MQKRILSSNIELTDAINDYLDKKLSQIEKYIKDDNTETIVDIDIGKTIGDQNSGDNLYKAEITLMIGGQQYRYVAEEHELYAAIDKMKDEIIRVLRKGKERKRDRFRRGALKMKNLILGAGRRAK